MPLPSDARLALKTSVLISPSEDGYFLYDVAERRLHHLNPVAALIVELSDGTNDLDAVRQSVVALAGESGWDASVTWIDGAVASGLLHGSPQIAPSTVSAKVLSERAAELRKQGEVLPAFICQEHAAELAPGDAMMWYRLGELAHIVGRREIARIAYERYFDRHPDDAEIGTILTALRNEPPPSRVPDECIEQVYTRFASFYDTNMLSDLDYRAPALLAEAAAVALGGRPHVDVLDLGCGTGLSGVALRPFARQLCGVDLSTAMVDQARERDVYDDLHVAEITAFLDRNPAARFDLIASCDALIYFGDLRQVVVPAAHRLAPGGLVAFTVERGEVYPFALTDSGRFAHHPDHVDDVAAAAGLAVGTKTEAVLRYEYGRPVLGLVVVLTGPVKRDAGPKSR